MPEQNGNDFVLNKSGEKCYILVEKVNISFVYYREGCSKILNNACLSFEKKKVKKKNRVSTLNI